MTGIDAANVHSNEGRSIKAEVDRRRLTPGTCCCENGVGAILPDFTYKHIGIELQLYSVCRCSYPSMYGHCDEADRKEKFMCSTGFLNMLTLLLMAVGNVVKSQMEKVYLDDL